MKKIVILAFLDGFANSIKPNEVKKILEKDNKVILIDTRFINRWSKKYSKLPSLVPAKFYLFLLEVIVYFSAKSSAKKHLYYPFLNLYLEQRKNILKKILVKYPYDVLICESQYDYYILLEQVNKTTIYDCATPWADESYFGGLLSKGNYEKFKKREIEVYEKVTHLSFHWESYGDYVKKYYNYKKNNILKLNAGVNLHKSLAKYSEKPKIVYFGYLGGYWINLPLLAKLSKIYTIDVYGGPIPNNKYALNYKGYAHTSILKNYQFGLITISKDQLRKNGFSAKHLEYLSYGLPVLCPDWRKTNIGGTIYYNEKNFIDIINQYKDKKTWEILQKKVLKQSAELQWENVLSPLKNILS